MTLQPSSAASKHLSRLVAVLAITLAILVVEVAGAAVTGSLALLADGGHMLTDFMGVGIAVAAIVLARRPASRDRTFGFYRLEILAAALNSVLLFGLAVFIVVEAARRFADPPEIEGSLVLVFAVAGLAGNAVSLWLLHGGQRESLNLRGAYLEVLGDLFGSAAVLVAALVIASTGFLQADPIASVAIGLLILPRTWGLLRDAVDVLLEAAPKNTDLAEIRRHIMETPNVVDAHDLHVWTITSGMNVISAHVIVEDGADSGVVLDRLAACLSGNFDIEHSTFQLENESRRRLEEAAHP